MSDRKPRKPKKHWYKTFYGECPVCGRDCSYKVRMYGKKPKRIQSRYEPLPLSVCYCGCVQ